MKSDKTIEDNKKCKSISIVDTVVTELNQVMEAKIEELNPEYKVALWLAGEYEDEYGKDGALKPTTIKLRDFDYGGKEEALKRLATFLESLDTTTKSIVINDINSYIHRLKGLNLKKDDEDDNELNTMIDYIDNLIANNTKKI